MYVNLSFHWVNDSGTRRFELVTCESQLVTRKLELLTNGFQLVTHKFELATREFELVDLNSYFWVSTHALKLSTPN